jgi:hypothetical protein
LKVTILSLFDDAPVNPCVTFATECGAALGTRIGERPHVGHSCVVELEVPDTLVWDESVSASDHPGCYLDADDDHAIVQGLLEQVWSVDQITVCVLRVATSLVTITTKGTLPSAGVWVRLRTPHLLLHDVNL